MGQLDSRTSKARNAVDEAASALEHLSDDDLSAAFEKANLSERGFRLARESAADSAEQFSQLEMPRPETVQELKARHKAELHEALRRLVFGADEPSVKGLQSYIERTRERGKILFPEKQEIASALNHFKAHLGVDFYFLGRRCRLTTNRALGDGSFRVSLPGKERRDLRCSDVLPQLKCRK